MSKGGIAVLIVAALIFTALGFAFGQVVQAANNPGPLVSEGWVERYVGEKLADMQLKIDELEAQLLQANAGGSGGSGTIPEPGGTTPTTPTTPTQANPTTVKVKNSSVNVRSDANQDASVVGSVGANNVLTYLGQKNDSQGRAWYNVKLSNGTEGWIAGWLCYDPE